MSQKEREYQDIVADEAEKLKEALKKKRRQGDDPLHTFGVAFLGGPVVVAVFMLVSFFACAAFDTVMP